MGPCLKPHCQDQGPAKTIVCGPWPQEGGFIDFRGVYCLHEMSPVGGPSGSIVGSLKTTKSERTHTMSRLDPHRVQDGPTPGPSLDPHRVQDGPTPCPVWTHTGSKFGPTPGPVYCLIFWSQVLLHFLVPGTASYPGPRYCLIPWSQVLPHTLVPKTSKSPGPIR